MYDTDEFSTFWVNINIIIIEAKIPKQIKAAVSNNFKKSLYEYEDIYLSWEQGESTSNNQQIPVVIFSKYTCNGSRWW